MSTRLRIEELLVPAAYPHDVSRLELRETHTSWIVLTGAFAYKIKKPVRFDFLNASTLERRAALCAEELRLNLRFAPVLYLGVVPVTREAGRLRVGGGGAPVEFAVRMRQFDPSQELAARLEHDSVTLEDVGALARLIAGLHQRAAVAGMEGPHGSCGMVRAQILDNLAQLRPHVPGDSMGEFDTLEGRVRDLLQHLAPFIAMRKRTGWIRECHGDLHAGNIVCWQKRWLAYDCLEFDPALRWIDVISDTAFLFMDLVARGQEELACQFLSRYLEVTGDYAGLRLLPLYAAHRALVRAKVAALRAPAVQQALQAALRAQVIARLRLAASFMAGNPAALVIMHGVTASGKSWLSERLVSTLHAVRIRSDLERKRLAGRPPLEHQAAGVGEGAYSAASTRHTYDRLLECAAAALEGGRVVIVDASFLDASHRDSFRELAVHQRCAFLIVSCHADYALLRKRLDARAHAGRDASEATPAVLDHQMRTRQELTPREQRIAVQIDTGRTGSDAAGVAAITKRLREMRGVDT